MVYNKLALLVSAAVLGSVAVDAKMVQQRASESLTMHRRAAASKDDQYVYSMNNPWQGFNATKWEPYVRYHARYMAINCPDQHDTEFFDSCCKPRLAEKPDDSDYPKACSEAVKGAPQPDKAAAAIEAKIYAPLLKIGQVGFGGGAKKTNPKKVVPNPKKTSTDADAAAKAKAAQEAADAKAKAAQEAADAKAEADREAAQKAAAQKQAQEKAKQQAQADQSNDDGGDDSSDNNGGDDDNKSGGGLGGLFSDIIGSIVTGGEATWYTQDGTTGACGKAVGDYDKVVALGIGVYGGPGDFSQPSKWCGKKVIIKNTANGKSVEAVVNDGCPGCNDRHLDLSLGAFDAIGDRNTGVLPIEWAFSN